MSEYNHIMDNDALQNAIIHTNAMLKACPVNEVWRHDKLKTHLSKLIGCQEKRSNLAVFEVNPVPSK